MKELVRLLLFLNENAPGYLEVEEVVEIDDESGDCTVSYGDTIAEDARNKFIVSDVANAVSEGRSPIILTARTSHVELLANECERFCNNVIKLVGNDSTKAKREAMSRLVAVRSDEPLIIVATGKYVGEGFFSIRPCNCNSKHNHFYYSAALEPFAKGY